MVGSASAMLRMACMSGVRIGDLSLFCSTAAARDVSLLASSSSSRFAFLCSFARSSVWCPFPNGERLEFGRGGSSDRRRGVASRSREEEGPPEVGRSLVPYGTGTVPYLTVRYGVCCLGRFVRPRMWL